jgi:arabinan endo-1,5-alpha-L-arabinosidase
MRYENQTYGRVPSAETPREYTWNADSEPSCLLSSLLSRMTLVPTTRTFPAVLALLAAAACSQSSGSATKSDSGGQTSSSGGAGAGGNSTGSGGAGVGGATDAGGATGAGGVSGSGGGPATGGTFVTGGAQGTGGSTGSPDASADVPDARDTSIADSGADGSQPDTKDAAPADNARLDTTPASTDGGVCPAPVGTPFSTSTTHLNIGVHDPAVISDGKRFYLFGTGGSLNVRSSTNGLQWSNAGQVFASVPSWVSTTLNVSATGFELWAPDVSFFNCEYHVYFAGSVFGKNTSVIGLATSSALDSASTKWVDEGLIIQSTSSDNFNAIDPNVSFDDTGAPWLSFGSFWDGIKMRKLDPATGKLSTADTTLYSLASRKGTGDAIEAPSIISHDGYYYLFVSFDTCCKGTSSTYRTMVGRSGKITGPYTDKAGTSMTKGAAEELLASSGRYIGPGGGTAFQNGGGTYYAFHYYDGDDNGNSKLQIRPVDWGSDDWPTLGQPLFP